MRCSAIRISRERSINTQLLTVYPRASSHSVIAFELGRSASASDVLQSLVVASAPDSSPSPATHVDFRKSCEALLRLVLFAPVFRDSSSVTAFYKKVREC